MDTSPLLKRLTESLSQNERQISSTSPDMQQPVNLAKLVQLIGAPGGGQRCSTYVTPMTRCVIDTSPLLKYLKDVDAHNDMKLTSSPASTLDKTTGAWQHNKSTVTQEWRKAAGTAPCNRKATCFFDRKSAAGQEAWREILTNKSSTPCSRPYSCSCMTLNRKRESYLCTRMTMT